MALCALFAALLTLCAWISIPAGSVVLSLQTLGVALTLWLLGGKRGSLTVLVYLLLGAVGLPVFSGFRGGVGALVGMTGGYLTGFLVWALVYWLITALAPDTGKVRILALVAGLLVCYGFGTFWFSRIYLQGEGLGLVLLQCVVPYLLPDGIKLTAAVLLGQRLSRFVY